MNGEEFKNIDIESKVEYINDLLCQGDSVDNIRMTLGVGKNYIANTFKKHGYSLNRNINQYVKSDSAATIATNVVKPTTKPVSEAKKLDNTNNKDNYYKALEGQIKDLQKQINDINNRLDNNSIATNVITDTTSIIHTDIDSLSNTDTVNRNYRLYTSIHEQFTMFCKSNKQYKVQDILSSAIKEYLDKHSK